MSTQTKLSDEQVKAVARAASELWGGLSFSETPEGHDYWAAIHARLQATANNGTSDGKPWGGPSPSQDIPAATVETPATVEDAATAVVIDDKWAAVWPRRWVMVRDTDRMPWKGPQKLGCVNSRGELRFRIVDGTTWTYCRPATAEEIAMLELPKAAKPEIGEGYREATEADKNRQDRDYWNKRYGAWREVCVGVYSADGTYRVPIDREPTAEDASARRTVMVRDNQEDPWVPRTLIAVLTEADNAEFPFVTIRRGRTAAAWQYARRLYPGENVLPPE